MKLLSHLSSNPRQGMSKLVCLTLPVIWAIVIAWLSLTPQPPEISGFFSWDKLQHAGAYGLLSFLIAQYLFGNKHSVFFSCLIACVVASLYGGLLEFLQMTMQAGRHAEWWDLLADFLGAIVGCVIFRQLILFLFSQHRTEIHG